MPGPITFVASGVRREGATRGGPGIPVPPAGRLKASVALTATRAAQEPDVRLEAVPDEDAVVVHIAGGPALWLHPEHASRVAARATRSRARARDGATATSRRRDPRTGAPSVADSRKAFRREARNPRLPR